jgi:FlaA1/EpsC-like NDP-sugar epimerase
MAAAVGDRMSTTTSYKAPSLPSGAATLAPLSKVVRVLGLRSVRLTVKYVGDAALLVLAYYFAYLLRFDGDLLPSYRDLFTYSLPLVVLTKIVLLHTYRLYGYFWRQTSLHELIELFKALSLAALFMTADYAIAVGEIVFPRSIILFDWGLGLLFLTAFRTVPRLVHDNTFPSLASIRQLRHPMRATSKQNVLVYGAGDLGASLMPQIERSFARTKQVLGFIDDDPAKKGMTVRGVEVLGDRSVLAELASRKKIDEIVIAISAISGRQLREIVEHCRRYSKTVQVAPGVDELFMGKVKVSDLRDVQIEDLLGRESAKVDLDEEGLHRFLAGKTILVTGAGGSIGGELCFQILKFRPRKIILFGRGENSIFATKHRLLPHAEGIEIEEVIGDIINYAKLDHVFALRRPELVFHAAADKHVPMMELNPDEAVLNNIIGTKNVLDVATRYGVEKVVCISSDKAVNPTNIMGCCKRVSELLVQSQIGSATVSCAVRFGNVMGSRGSVIPLFKQQIANGGPITLTHPDITRYFMTIPEAVLLVLQAGALSKGGEIFVLEMGQQIKIADLARQMIRLSGVPEDSIEIKYIGLRPGEKLYEELSLADETLHRTDMSKLYRLDPRPVSRVDLEAHVEILKHLGIHMDFEGIRRALKELVPEYQPQDPSYQPNPEVTPAGATALSQLALN